MLGADQGAGGSPVQAGTAAAGKDGVQGGQSCASVPLQVGSWMPRCGATRML